ncbi:dethiobiotin synthase [Devriesea agamarum]|uniref:dethiobiotin synthase n=1 Tax=Devriesea agamarum TaxID=472569 RepID=UPI00071DA45C|nr:dethiobiotin synthase [Devriesea agamarum]
MAHRGRITIVTGTDTDVGKTIATATIAAALVEAGRKVAIVKPVQTGLPPRRPDIVDGDVDIAARLSGASTALEGVRFTRPMAPRQAARLEGRCLPNLEVHCALIDDAAATHDEVLVEGAGGMLVELAPQRTIVDLALALRQRCHVSVSSTASQTCPAPDQHPSGDPCANVRVLVVTRSRLGTLNHTALTIEALTARSLTPAGIVIGSWPEQPDEIDRENLSDLRAGSTPVLATIPAGLGQVEPEEFRRRVREIADLHHPPAC